MQSGKCGANLTWTLEDNGTLTISGKGEMESYSYDKRAPWYYLNDSIYSIYYLNDSIKKITIPDSVTTIGDSAFRGCTHLTSITIPDSVTTIGDSAFRGCTHLTSITIPDSVTTIGDWAFSDCTLLTSITIPDSVTTIGNHAFDNCKNLTEVKISDSVTTIGDWAFNFCELLKEVKISKNVEAIGELAFNWCKNLREIKLPDKLKEIGSRAFFHCENLREIRIPKGVTRIGDDAFNGCIRLKGIHYRAGSISEYKLRKGNDAKLIPYNPAQFVDNPTINLLKFMPVANPAPQAVTEKLRWKVEGKTLTVGGVREIENYSYSATLWNENLRDIQKIIIEDGVEKLSARAFENCTRLEQLIISASVKTIGDFAFTYCYCGDRKINSGTNVIWSLEDGTLMIKKNPAAKSDADFSTGYPTWEVVEKNITGVKIERGIVPGKRFFDWLAHMGNSVQVSF